MISFSPDSPGVVWGENVGLPATELEGLLADLQGRIPGGDASLTTPIVSFETGTDLNRFSDAIGRPYDMKDVTQ